MSAYHPDLPHGAGLIMISLAYYQHFVDAGCCPERFARMAQALELSRTLDADYLGLRHSAAFRKPWRKDALLGGFSMADRTLEASAQAVIQRSYHADG